MLPASPKPYRLKLLGAPDLRGPDGEQVRSLVSQPKRLCLLAYLAMASEPVSRSTLVALFWPESDEERARNALSQAVHYLRRSLTKGAVDSVDGDRLWVPREVVWCDARELLAREGAVGEGLAPGSGGGFMDGWNADDSQALQEWLDGVRRGVEGVLGERGASVGSGSADGGAAADGGHLGLGDSRERTRVYRKLCKWPWCRILKRRDPWQQKIRSLARRN
ncbi:MAG: hypothetical protein O2956_03295 [Gemmatimonadetes bacterium]|nr:hypothetical protein [Gemmatimonadota bacterium]